MFDDIADDDDREPYDHPDDDGNDPGCNGLCDPMCDDCLLGHDCPEVCGGGSRCPYYVAHEARERTRKRRLRAYDRATRDMTTGPQRRTRAAWRRAVRRIGPAVRREVLAARETRAVGGLPSLAAYVAACVRADQRAGARESAAHAYRRAWGEWPRGREG